MPKPDKIKVPKGHRKAPSKTGLEYKNQGPHKRQAVLTADIGGNTVKATIDYDYKQAPPELLDVLDEQYDRVIEIIGGEKDCGADEAAHFLISAASAFIAGVSEVQSMIDEE